MPTLPPDAVCSEDGCTQPLAGVRPSTREYILQDKTGLDVQVYAPGEVDEGACAEHAEHLWKDETP